MMWTADGYERLAEELHEHRRVAPAPRGGVSRHFLRAPRPTLPVSLGDRVFLKRAGVAVVVGVLDKGVLDPSLVPSRWSALRKGMLVRMPGGEINHVREPELVLVWLGAGAGGHR